MALADADGMAKKRERFLDGRLHIRGVQPKAGGSVHADTIYHLLGKRAPHNGKSALALETPAKDQIFN